MAHLQSRDMSVDTGSSFRSVDRHASSTSDPDDRSEVSSIYMYADVMPQDRRYTRIYGVRAAPQPVPADDSRDSEVVVIVNATASSSESDRCEWSQQEVDHVPKRHGGGGEDHRDGILCPFRPSQLFRTIEISALIRTLYRLLAALRLAAVAALLAWRFRHPSRDARWLWAMSVVCETWFAISWALHQLPLLKAPLINHSIAAAAAPSDAASAADLLHPPLPPPHHQLLLLPSVDVFIFAPSSSSSDSPILLLSIANSILSVLASDYPPHKLSCYLSDDSASLLLFDALASAASFARFWVPFCRKHSLLPRHPHSFFSTSPSPTHLPPHSSSSTLRHDFLRDRRRIRRLYDQFKVRINGLPDAVRRRSDAYNVREESKSRRCRAAAGWTAGGAVSPPPPLKATWMSDGRHWPGAWLESGASHHTCSHHAAIVQVMLAPPSSEAVYQQREESSTAKNAADGDEDDDEKLDFTGVDVRLPTLVYVSRERRPGYDNNQKAGAMNALLRCSSVMSNAAFVLTLDSDTYVFNPMALRYGIGLLVSGDDCRNDVCYVQFPQRFDEAAAEDSCGPIDDNASMLALDGIQGPMHDGTRCMFRRLALYGFDPPLYRNAAIRCRRPRRNGQLGNYFSCTSWFLRRFPAVFRRRNLKSLGVSVDATDKKNEIADGVVISDVEQQQQQEQSKIDYDSSSDDEDVEERRELLNPLAFKTYGGSAAFLQSMHMAEAAELRDRPAAEGAGIGCCRPKARVLEENEIAEAASVISCWYEDKTEWGRSLGWVYGTSEIATGYRMHSRGWRSVYGGELPDAFRRVASTDLADQLREAFRRAAGAVDMFLSRDNGLLASHRMKWLQRVAYVHAGAAPLGAVFLVFYCFLPSICLLSDRFIVPELDAPFLAYMLAMGLCVCGMAVLEMRWAGMTVEEWWRKEQLWMIAGTSAHLVAASRGLLKAVTGVDVSLAAAAAAEEEEEEEEEEENTCEVRWTWLLVLPLTIVMVNMTAAAVAAARLIYGGGNGRKSQLIGGFGLSAWVLVHMLPLGKGLIAGTRRRPPPAIVWIWATLFSLTLALLWVIAAQIYASAAASSSFTL